MSDSADTRPAEPRRAARLREALGVALLVALVVALFWRIALAGRVLAGGDVFTYFYPYWADATRAIQAGRLPLWNPYLFMGAPLLANSQVGVFYPLNWPLWLLLPAHQSIHLSIVLHVCLAALSAYLWGRVSMRLGRAGAWTVGAVYALGGYLGAQVEHVNQLQGLAWLPLMLLLYDVTLVQAGTQRPSRARLGAAFAGLVLVVALVLLAGHTQTAFISLAGLAAYGLGPALPGTLRGICRRLRRERESADQAQPRGADRSPAPRRWLEPLARRTALLVAVSALGAVLAAVQLVPTWELSRLSVRAGGLPFNERVSFSLSPFYLARAFLPAFGHPVSPDHIEYVAYTGVAALALATLAILHPRTPAPPHPHTPTLPPSHPPLSILHSPFSNLQPETSNPQLLLLFGLFLSLGLYNPVYLLLARFVPGFAHFRAPARWLVLSVLGLAALAGRGADLLWCRRGRVGWRRLLVIALVLLVLAGWGVLGVGACRQDAGGPTVDGLTVSGWAAAAFLALGLLWAARRVPRLAVVGLLALLVVECLAASSALPHSRATAPQAFTSLRPAIAHLVSARDGSGAPAGRFISMSDITFDPGDLPEIELIYGPQLAADALYDYVVAAKHKEVLSPNLPLAFGVPAVDGYGGGVLPLARYVALQELFLPAPARSIDGRLRENMTAIPEGRWLNLFNVRHVVTDKLHDAWLDDVFYDLQFGASLARGEAAEVAHVPQFEATALGVVSYLHGGAALPEGSLVGVVEIGFGGGVTRTFDLRAGEHTAEGLHGPHVAHAQAAVGGHFWPGEPEGNDYVARLLWPEPAVPASVRVRSLLPEGELVVRGVSLIDERTGGFQALVLSDQGHFRLAHSGDVKIYENLDLLPRAFLVHRAVQAADDGQALNLMREPEFDPASVCVLSVDRAAAASGPGASSGEALGSPSGAELVRVRRYAPEHVEIALQAEAPGYLVLTDAWYPGWVATVDGAPVPVQRADLYFRAVAVEAGDHHVEFDFRPLSLRVGAGLSLAGLLVLAASVALLVRCPKRGAML